MVNQVEILSQSFEFEYWYTLPPIWQNASASLHP
jgi:hypothetical protein